MPVHKPIGRIINKGIDNIQGGLKTILRDTFDGPAINSESASGAFPWGKPYDTEELAFFTPYDIKADRWNKLYPYRLVVVDVSDPGNLRIVTGNSGSVRSNSEKNVKASGGIEYVLSQEIVSGRWIVNLPITPQQLQVTDQFAINTTATMRGIVEEHNGIKFKMINASGTTGIWPRKPTEGGKISSPKVLQSIFAGAISGFNQLVDSANKIAKAFSGEHPNKPSNSKKPEESDAGEFSTGYYQALYMAQFLERYAMAKRRPENKNWRLVFDMPKQNQSFIVTPMTFSLKQDHQKPNEILFSMQLKAWKRINLQDTTGIAPSTSFELGPNEFQKLLNIIRETRRTLGSASNLIKAVRSDFQGIFNIIRQTSLILKDLGGIVTSLADFPNSILEDLKSSVSIYTAFNGNKTIITSSTESGIQRPTGSSNEDPIGAGLVRKSAISIKNESQASKAGQIINSIIARNKIFEGLSEDQVQDGALGQEARISLETDPINEVFENPEENFNFFDSIDLDSIEMTSEQQEFIDNELEKIDLITIDDLRGFKSELLSLALDISNSFGSGDQTYSDVYGVTDPKDRATPLTIEENEVLTAIFNSIQVYDELTATKQLDDDKNENPLEYVGGLTEETEIEFEDFPAKIPVPVPFGLTIEELAARYMNDPDKWLEIVTLNSLRSPYIDEEGFVLDFISNADGRQFNITTPSDEHDRLFIGQKITIKSDLVPSFTRKIIDVEEISEGNILITVDGLGNLDNLKTADNARMQGYLPGTVNSQNQIFIPVNLAAQEDDRIFEIAGLLNPTLTKISKVDFLLTDDGDIALNAIGDFRLANGLTNLVQAIKIKIRTEKGTLLRHLNFGIGLSPGISIADIEQGAVIEAMNQMIYDDPRFEAVERISMRLDGSTLAIDLSIRIANGNGVLPISFNLNL